MRFQDFIASSREHGYHRTGTDTGVLRANSSQLGWQHSRHLGKKILLRVCVILLYKQRRLLNGSQMLTNIKNEVTVEEQNHWRHPI